MGLGVDEGRKRVIGDHGSDPSRPWEDRDCSTGKMGEDQEATELAPLIPYIMAGVDTQSSLGRMHCGKFREVSGIFKT